MSLSKLEDRYEIRGVCDAMELRRKEAEQAVGCSSYESFEEMLKHCDADWVVIATPQTFHREQCLAALQAGKHVVCEKPMAMSYCDAQEMAAAARTAQRHLTVFHNLHYASDFQKVREVLQSGKLGRILLIKIYRNGFGRRWDWQTLKKFGGGNLANTGPHVLDHALCLMGAEEPNVIARLETAITLGDADDHTKLLLHLPGYPLVDLELSSADAIGGERWKICGTAGGLTGGDAQLRWRYFDPASLPERTVVETPSPERAYDKETIDWREESWMATPDEQNRSLPVAYYTDLHGALSRGEAPPITATHALSVMRVIEMAHANSV